MATQRQLMCSIFLVLLVFASNWEAAVSKECWTRSEKITKCWPPWNKECTNECKQENYKYAM
ncbi:hypothetical protein ACP70R_045573 [Stipagrostis hirtigluma subsp. patula]